MPALIVTILVALAAILFYFTSDAPVEAPEEVDEVGVEYQPEIVDSGEVTTEAPMLDEDAESEPEDSSEEPSAETQEEEPETVEPPRDEPATFPEEDDETGKPPAVDDPEPEPDLAAQPEVVANTNVTVTADYKVPSGITENVKATFTLEGKKVVAVSTQYFDAIGPSANYQKGFEGAYKGQVIGKDIDEVELFRVGGASLTSQAFNKAVGMVKVQLQSK